MAKSITNKMKRKMNRIRLSTYNILGGMKGTGLVEDFMNHFYLHVLKSAKQIKARTRPFKEIAPFLKQTKADILCLNEVFHALHKTELVKELKKMGYKTITFGKSLQHKPPIDFSTVIATKYLAQRIPIKLPQIAKAGGGGGVCAVYIPKKNLTVVGLHLALQRKLRRIQLKSIGKFVKKQKSIGRKVILMGDFNSTQKELKKTEIQDFGFEVSPSPATFPAFPSMFLRKRDIDHIVHSSAFQQTGKCDITKGNSDHMMLSCELKH